MPRRKKVKRPRVAASVDVMKGEAAAINETGRALRSKAKSVMEETRKDENEAGPSKVAITNRGKRIKLESEKKMPEASKSSTKSESQTPQKIKTVQQLGGDKDPLSILPEEMWTEYLQHVDPKDLYSCMKTCTLFERILKPTKTAWLFESVFPLLFRYLKKSRILRCRLVCRDWKYAVNHYFEDHPSLRYSSNDGLRRSTTTPMKKRRIGLYTLCNVKDRGRFPCNLLHSKFLEKMGTCPTNPFIGRYLTIIDFHKGPSTIVRKANGEERICEFWDYVYKFLEVFGKHIYYLKMSAYCRTRGTFDEELQLRFLLWDIFTLMPKLRLLRIAGHDQPFYSPQSIENIGTIVVDAPKLETIQIENLRALPSPLVDILFVTLAPQLKRVHYHLCKPLLELEWPCLTELHLGSLRSEWGFQCLGLLQLPCLRILGFELLMVKDEKKEENKLCLRLLLKALNKLSETSKNLQTLQIQVWGGFKNDLFPTNDDLQFNSNLLAPPSIKGVHLIYNSFDGIEGTAEFNFGFFLLFPTVEHISVCGMRYPPPPLFRDKEKVSAERDKIDMLHMVRMNLPYQSNIWELLPKLKVFRFEKKKCTRHGYRNYVEKQKKKRVCECRYCHPIENDKEVLEEFDFCGKPKL